MSKAVNQLIAYFAEQGRLTEAQIEHLQRQGFDVPFIDPHLEALANASLFKVNDRPFNYLVKIYRDSNPFDLVGEAVSTFGSGTLRLVDFSTRKPRMRFVFEHSAEGHGSMQMATHCSSTYYLSPAAGADLRPLLSHPGAVILKAPTY